MSAKPLSTDQLAKLGTIDSPTIANIIELFKVRSRIADYTSYLIKALYPKLPPAVGYAITGEYRTGYPSTTEDGYGALSDFIESGAAIDGPLFAVIQDLDDTPRAAVYGDIVASSLQRFGCVGLLSNGAGRDLEQVEALNFPCFASSVIVSHGDCHFENIGQTVTVAGLKVRPGDLLHGDGNGVIKIPHNIAAGVAAMADDFLAAENDVLAYLKRDDATPAGLGKMHTALKQRLTELSKKAQALIEQ
jgi:4-hydroxy-4-methyl-2-oxoglutarate aldolase